MDPTTALGVAGNIVQFIDFAWGLLHSTSTIYKSETGQAEQHNTLGAIARDAARLSHTCTFPPAVGSSPEQDTLRALGERCKVIANDLLQALSKLRVKTREEKKKEAKGEFTTNRKWDSFLITLKTVWETSKINSLTEQLQDLQNQISNHIQFLTLQYIRQQGSHLSLIENKLDKYGMQGLSSLQDLFDSIKRKELYLSNYGDLIRKEMLENLTFNFDQYLHQMTSMSNAINDLEKRKALADFQQNFLGTLYFSKIEARLRKIEPAHANTFEWIFEDYVPDGSKSIGFSHWLHHGQGAFWIQGKAGSGKSTLMKFISNHERTMQPLRTWAGSSKLVTGSFYFWNSGTTLQKSREGLLRSLLFEVLRKCPDLISYVSAATQNHGTREQLIDEIGIWSQEELLDAYRALVDVCDEVGVKFCFFIDGLDEFEEENQRHSDLVITLRVLGNSHNIKFCVSSRPWSVFSDAFGGDEKCLLKLEDLTRDDIRRYVKDKFNGNNQFRALSETSDDYTQLVDQISCQAQGVFLWVFLVVRDLLDGFTHSDTIGTLRKRLWRFPDDLESFFQHMIDCIFPVQIPLTARTLWMATSVGQPQFLVVYSLLDDIADNFTSFNLQHLSMMSESEVSQRLEQMRRRLDGRCKGLLEVVEDEPDSVPYFRYKVDFLHRTVRDFLFDSPDIHNMIEKERFSDIQDPQDGWLLPCVSLLAAIKRAPFRPAREPPIVQLLTDLLHFAHDAENNMHTHSTLKGILHHAEWTYKVNASLYAWDTDPNIFLGLACKMSTMCFVREQVDLDLVGKNKPLLAYALEPLIQDVSGIANFSSRNQVPILRYLLDLGANPNQTRLDIPGRKSETVWTHFIKYVFAESNGPIPSNGEIIEATKLLLIKGADLLHEVELSDMQKTTKSAESLIQARLRKEHADELFRQARDARTKLLLDGKGSQGKLLDQKVVGVSMNRFHNQVRAYFRKVLAWLFPWWAKR